MRKLLGKRIPLAWFLLALIGLAAAGIVWRALSNSLRDSGAVLIYSAPAITESKVEDSAVVDVVRPTRTARSATRTATAAPSRIAVYVSGAVAAPGVYNLLEGARVSDAVEAAGGFTSEADREAINLAGKLRDEQHISVPVVGASDNAVAKGSVSPTVAAQAPVQPTKAVEPPTPASVAGRINVNTAGLEELDQLPGIGQVLAGRIIADREANGAFRSVDDLLRVPGIGEVMLAKLRELVTVGP